MEQIVLDNDDNLKEMQVKNCDPTYWKPSCPNFSNVLGGPDKNYALFKITQKHS